MLSLPQSSTQALGLNFSSAQLQARVAQRAVGSLHISSQQPILAICPQMLVPLLLQYLETLSGLVDSNLNCGPVLTWMEVGRGPGAEIWE